METAVLSSILNFSLVVGTLYFAGRKPLASFLASRSDSVGAAIDEAERLSRISEAELARWTNLLGHSRSEVDILKAESKSMIVALNEKTQLEARRETERVQKEAELVSATEYARAKRQLEAELCSGSVELAKNYLSENLNGDVASQLLADTLERVNHAR